MKPSSGIRWATPVHRAALLAELLDVDTLAAAIPPALASLRFVEPEQVGPEEWMRLYAEAILARLTDPKAPR